VGRDRVVAVAVLVEAGDHEPRVDLTPDLVLQRVAALEGVPALDLPPRLLLALARRVG
jgi:hypothetical protein